MRFSAVRVMLATAIIVMLAAFVARPMIKMLDAALFGYVLTDQYVRTKIHEDWSTAAPLRSGLDYSWAKPDRSGAVRIAHALGAWNSDRDRNTLNALNRAINGGFLLAEVDLTLGADGDLYCYHGPDDRPAILSAWETKGMCRLDDLAVAMRTAPFALVLDLKSDFRRSAAAAAARIPLDLRNRIIFQLYGAADVAVFNDLPRGFAGPIVTLYRTLRTVHHLDPELSRIGARVVTVPLARMDEFSAWGQRGERILLTHPIETCAMLERVRRAGFAGGYLDSGLKCRPTAFHQSL